MRAEEDGANGADVVVPGRHAARPRPRDNQAWRDGLCLLDHREATADLGVGLDEDRRCELAKSVKAQLASATDGMTMMRLGLALSLSDRALIEPALRADRAVMMTKERRLNAAGCLQEQVVLRSGR